jgi:hypothetical protein
MARLTDPVPLPEDDRVLHSPREIVDPDELHIDVQQRRPVKRDHQPWLSDVLARERREHRAESIEHGTPIRHHLVQRRRPRHGHEVHVRVNVHRSRDPRPRRRDSDEARIGFEHLERVIDECPVRRGNHGVRRQPSAALPTGGASLPADGSSMRVPSPRTASVRRDATSVHVAMQKYEPRRLRSCHGVCQGSPWAA